MHVLYFEKIENRKKNVNRPKKIKMTSFLPEKQFFWLEKTRFAWKFFFWLKKISFGSKKISVG